MGLGPRALRVPIIGLTWCRGALPPHHPPPPGIGAFGADAGALGPGPHKALKGLIRLCAARSLWLRCPKCTAIRDVRNLTLQTESKSMAIRCNTCKHTCASHKWQCQYGMAWSACPACRPRGFACRAPMRLIKRDHQEQTNATCAPDWVPRASKRMKRGPPPSSSTIKRTAYLARATAAYSSPPIATTTIVLREGSSGVIQPSFKRRLRFEPDTALASKFPGLAMSHSQGG